MIDVTPTHFLECKEYESSPDGGVAFYLLRAVPKDGGVTETLRLKPHDLNSYKRFREALLGRCIFYLATREEHGRNLVQLMRNRLLPHK